MNTEQLIDSEMIADNYSRHPYQLLASTNIAKDYVTFVAYVSQPLALSLSDITIATNSNIILKISHVHKNTWDKQPCSINETFLCYKMLDVEISVISVEKGDV